MDFQNEMCRFNRPLTGISSDSKGGKCSQLGEHNTLRTSSNFFGKVGADHKEELEASREGAVRAGLMLPDSELLVGKPEVPLAVEGNARCEAGTCQVGCAGHR